MEDSNTTLVTKKELINDIESRIRVMKKVCSAIRTLHEALVLHGGIDDIVISLESFNESYIDRRPIISYGLVTYLDFRRKKLLTKEDKNWKSINELSKQDLIILHNYFKMMVPKTTI